MKLEINPMQSAHQALRCSAHSKRTGKPCRAPAVKGFKVCRMHGANGGAPMGKLNGRYTYGEHTKKAKDAHAKLRLLLKTCDEFADQIS